jgi:hypothetical protein
MKIRHIEKIIICKFFSFQINLKINAYSLSKDFQHTPLDTMH